MADLSRVGTGFVAAKFVRSAIGRVLPRWRYLTPRYWRSFVRNPGWWLRHWHLNLRQKRLRVFGVTLWTGDLWLPPSAPCPDCRHRHRLSGCLCGCQNTGWR